MYKIIGADQREYGPVTADQILEWIKEGRANGATLVQAEGASEWSPLSTYPELNAFLPQQPAGFPPGTPDGSAALPRAPIDPMQAPPIDIGSCLSRSWALFSANVGLLVGATLVLLILIVAVNQVIGLFTRNMVQSLMAGNFEPGVIVGLVLWNLPEMAFSWIMTGGFYILLLKLIRGEPAAIGDVFAGFGGSALQLAMGGVVVQLLTLAGLLACILPGVYLSVSWILTGPLIVDRRMDFWSAMELSRKVVTRGWWLMFCLVLLVAVISMLGFIACCVGLLVALPVGLGAFLYAYEDLFHGPARPGPGV